MMDGSQLIASVFPEPPPFVVFRPKDVRLVMPAMGAKWLIEPMRDTDVIALMDQKLNEEHA